MRWLLASLLVGIGAGALWGCRPAPTSRAEADTGDASPRIVSLSPGLSIILGDLGLDGFVVGRHGWDRALDQAVPVVGDQTGIDYEALARVRPTHILLEESADDRPALLDRLAGQRGWEVLFLPMRTLDDIAAAVDSLAGAFGDVEGVAGRASAVRDRMEAAWRPDEGLARRAGRTLIVYWTSPLGVAGPGSFHHDLLRRLGVQALPETGGPYQTLDAEDLRRLNPDSIILLTPELDAQGVALAERTWAGWGVRAATTGRVAALRQWRFLTPSTAMIDLAQRIEGVTASWPAPSESAPP